MNTKLENFQENVKRLGEITAQMASGPICGLGPPKVFQIPGGEAKVWLLHERDTVSIVKAYVTPNSTFPIHDHKVIEVIVVFEGSAVYESGVVRKELLPGGCVHVPVGRGHKITTGPEGAWFSVTTVPREGAMTGGSIKIIAAGADDGR
jgi:anti-sigma factor ChrR (cupin superfamily)